MSAQRKASSQVSWALLMEGVTQARLEAHRLRFLLSRAQALVAMSSAKEHLWQVAGDLILGFPERMSELERALDRTNYALVVMGEDFLRGRIPLDDRSIVDESTKPHPYASPRLVKDMASRVAGRYLSSKGVAPSAEPHFFYDPKKRETREFAQTGALSNIPSVAKKSVKDMDNTDLTPEEAKNDAKVAPPTPSEIVKKPGGEQFGTLNRLVVKTEQPGTKGLPKGHEDIDKTPKPKGNL